MTDWWTISAWVMTAFFGALNVFQFIREIISKKIQAERQRSMMAVKLGLVQLRAMLTEAGTLGEVVKTDAAQQFVRNIGHQVKTIEHYVDSLLGANWKIVIEQPEQAPPTPPPAPQR